MQEVAAAAYLYHTNWLSRDACRHPADVGAITSPIQMTPSNINKLDDVDESSQAKGHQDGVSQGGLYT